MNSLKKLFTSLFGLSKKNKNRGKKDLINIIRVKIKHTGKA